MFPPGGQSLLINFFFLIVLPLLNSPRPFEEAPICLFKMSKRAADASDEQSAALKAGERPIVDATPDEVGEFEDEFEDEFESEDEILEAGVDGRPDAEREEEERGMWNTPAHWYNDSVN